jgi:hypothetical protein
MKLKRSLSDQMNETPGFTRLKLAVSSSTPSRWMMGTTAGHERFTDQQLGTRAVVEQSDLSTLTCSRCRAPSRRDRRRRSRLSSTESSRSESGGRASTTVNSTGILYDDSARAQCAFSPSRSHRAPRRPRRTAPRPCARAGG